MAKQWKPLLVELAEPWTLQALKEYFDKQHADLGHRLDGFPQAYQTKADGEAMEKAIGEIRADHVQRREIEELKSRQEEGSGRRTGGMIAISVVATLLAVMLGWIAQNGLTSSEVSTQIQREAPWNRDRPEVIRRVSQLEDQNRLLSQRVSALEGQVRFFCRTRTQAGLPGC